MTRVLDPAIRRSRKRCSWIIEIGSSMTSRGLRPWDTRHCKRWAEYGTDRCWQHRAPS